MNIKEAIELGIKLLKENKIQEPVLKCKIILANILQKKKEYLLINENEIIDKTIEEKYNKQIEKLCNHIPLQYITNKQEFMGIDFYIDENVLIPQPDTEILVEEAISICKKENINKTIQILDLCTGSGAIGISIAKNIENASILLSDISIKALDVANKNIERTGICSTKNKIDVVQSDLFENINNKFDVIVSNPPYIKTEIINTLDKEVQNEPLIALDGGQDGLEIYRKIIAESYKYLNKDGYLCLEIGYDQKEEVIELLNRSKKFKDIYSKKDLAGNDRIVICKRGDI